MKAKYILVGLLMVALVMGGTGYSVSAGSGDKATGGGTFINNTGWPSDYASWGDKITFGFNAQGQGSGVKGQFNLINHNSGMKASGTVSELTVFGNTAKMAGTCSIDGVPTSFQVMLSDGGEGGSSDFIVGIWFNGSLAISGEIAKGNIQSHK